MKTSYHCFETYHGRRSFFGDIGTFSKVQDRAREGSLSFALHFPYEPIANEESEYELEARTRLYVLHQFTDT